MAVCCAGKVGEHGSALCLEGGFASSKVLDAGEHGSVLCSEGTWIWQIIALRRWVLSAGCLMQVDIAVCRAQEIWSAASSQGGILNSSCSAAAKKRTWLASNSSLLAH